MIQLLTFQKRFSMLLLRSLKPGANVVDQEAVRDLVREAMERGFSDEDLEKCQVEVTYRLVPYGEVSWVQR